MNVFKTKDDSAKGFMNKYIGQKSFETKATKYQAIERSRIKVIKVKGVKIKQRPKLRGSQVEGKPNFKRGPRPRAIQG